MKRRDGLVIAIDGVVGSGKTTTARRVAEALGYRHLDTGAMYRAVTLAATQQQIEPDDAARLERLLAETEISFRSRDSGGGVLLNGVDVSEAIRRPEVTRRVGPYADVPLVRRSLIAQQQRMGETGGVVAEGRDTGSVVFPDADLKVRMVAQLAVRARRRYQELIAKGVSTSLEDVAADIESRDAQDAARDYRVTCPPTDVIDVDTTEMTLDEQVGHIVALARNRGA